MLEIRLEEHLADTRVFLLVKIKRVDFTLLVVHSNDILAGGETDRAQERCVTSMACSLNRPAPVKNLGDFRGWSGSFHKRDNEASR